MSSETSKTAPSARAATAALLFLLCLAGVGLRAFLSLALRVHAAGPTGSAAFWGWSIAAAAAATAVLVAFVALLRRKEEWMLYLGAAFLFILLYKSVRYRPEIASVELPLALFLLSRPRCFSRLFCVGSATATSSSGTSSGRRSESRSPSSSRERSCMRPEKARCSFRVSAPHGGARFSWRRGVSASWSRDADTPGDPWRPDVALRSVTSSRPGAANE